MHIDKVFIVHYSPLVNRKENLTNMLQIHQIHNYEFITDFDRDNTPRETLQEYFKGNDMTPAQICITISHFEIYKKIVENNYDLVLILEDDALLSSDFGERLEFYCSQLPSDFEIGFINSGCGFHAQNVTPDKIWYEATSSRTCCSYMITKECCKKLLDGGLPFKEVIDFELNRKIKGLNLKCYWCEPTIVTDGSAVLYGQSYLRFNQL